jgi:hypothetical protein
MSKLGVALSIRNELAAPDRLLSHVSADIYPAIVIDIDGGKSVHVADEERIVRTLHPTGGRRAFVKPDTEQDIIFTKPADAFVHGNHVVVRNVMLEQMDKDLLTGLQILDELSTQVGEPAALLL